MTIRVNLIENGRFAEILSDGHVTRREAGWATERVREMVSCVPLPGSVARALGQPDGQPGLAYHMEGFERRGRPISYQIAWFPPTDHRLVLGEKHE